MSDVLQRLQRWYAEQCNGDWEHQYGVEVGTLDNPGWAVTIDLHDTPLANKPFSEVSRLGADRDWIRCWLEGGKFHGVGGPPMLREILEVFLDWAER